MSPLDLMLSAAALAVATGSRRFPDDPSLALAYEYAAAGHAALAIRLAEQALVNAREAKVDHG